MILIPIYINNQSINPLLYYMLHNITSMNDKYQRMKDNILILSILGKNIKRE